MSQRNQFLVDGAVGPFPGHRRGLVAPFSLGCDPFPEADADRNPNALFGMASPPGHARSVKRLMQIALAILIMGLGLVFLLVGNQSIVIAQTQDGARKQTVESESLRPDASAPTRAGSSPSSVDGAGRGRAAHPSPCQRAPRRPRRARRCAASGRRPGGAAPSRGCRDAPPSRA